MTVDMEKLEKAVDNGKIFYVEFFKRSTGEIRKMRCRRGVTKHLKGGKLAYDPRGRQLLTVFDMESQGYRMIPADNILKLSVGGEKYTFEVKIDGED